MNSFSAAAIAATASWSAGRPNRSTGMTALGLSPRRLAWAIARSRLVGSMLNVASSTSANTGVAPSSAATSAVAQNVKDGQITASPGPIPRAISTSTSASVPLAQLTAWRAPQNVASSASSARTSGPRMNWQCSVTRAIASSIAAPSRRRCASTSMNGIGLASLWAGSVMESGPRYGSAGHAARALARGRHIGGTAVEAADRDLEARHPLLTGHLRPRVAAHRGDERRELGAQRLGVADREVAHRVAAVGLEAEAFGDLPGQQVADHVLGLGRDVHGARLERRKPVGVDVGEHARGGAELQKRDVLALGLGAGELRLHLDDLGLGEPADQVDVVHREIDHHADVRHARRERAHPGDGDREDVLVAQRLLDRLHGGIETLDV